MNLKLAEATTSVAFLLSLSKRQCNTLLRLTHGTADGHIVQVDSLRSLDRRGLVFWHQDATGRACGFGGLTEAGRLVAALLVEAGLTVEATNTTGVIRRMESAGATWAEHHAA